MTPAGRTAKTPAAPAAMPEDGPRQDTTAAPRPPTGPVRAGTETILVVESHLAASAETIRTLQALGYLVLSASDVQAALEILQGGAPVDLLFADLAAPGATGGDGLAMRARELLPGIAVLFTSAAGPEGAGHDLDGGVELLDQPFGPEDLACKVRHVLGNQQQVNVLATVLHEAPPASAAGAAEPPLRVLLVEDQEDVRDTSRQLLELLGCQVEAVPDAEAAEAALRGMRFEVIMTDVVLPGRSGVELARDAARLQPQIRIVLASGYREPPGAQALQGMATWNLPKPYGVPELESLLRALRRP